jgi:hypothetical protein
VNKIRASSRSVVDGVSASGGCHCGARDSGPESVDGYLPAGRLGTTVRFFGLRADPAGNVTIRATKFDIDVVRDLTLQGTVLAALDAATSRDPRARGVGERALTGALDQFRR